MQAAKVDPREASFAALTTLGLGGPAPRLVTVEREEDAVTAVQGSDAEGRPLLILGGGSNLVVSDAGFDGTVVRMATRGLRKAVNSASGRVHVTAQAGEVWDDFVSTMVDDGLVGVECLA